MLYQVGTSLYRNEEEAHAALAARYLEADGLNSKHDILEYQKYALIAAVDYEDQASDMIPDWYDRQMMVTAINLYQTD